MLTVLCGQFLLCVLSPQLFILLIMLQKVMGSLIPIFTSFSLRIRLDSFSAFLHARLYPRFPLVYNCNFSLSKGEEERARLCLLTLFRNLLHISLNQIFVFLLFFLLFWGLTCTFLSKKDILAESRIMSLSCEIQRSRSLLFFSGLFKDVNKLGTK